jgi:uncharacterized protein (DUF2147 family)
MELAMAATRNILIVALIAASPVLAAPAPPLEPYGVWLRAESGTAFDFYNCAEKLCAKVIAVTKLEDKKAIGTVILRNAVKNEDGEWAGDLFNTQDGKTYAGTIAVKNPAELTLTGCLISFLCKSETWQRAKDQSAASTPNGTPPMPAPPPKPGLGH